MANTYTQLGVHFVTAVKHRLRLVEPNWRARIHLFIKTVIEERGHVLLAVFFMSDHVHVFVSMHPDESVSALMGSWKSQTSGFITRTFNIDFEFQRGYGAFSVSKSLYPRVKKYINNQEAHHSDQTFRSEYIEILETHDVVYDERYLFDEVYLG